MHVSGVTEGKAKGKFQVVDFALMSNCNKIVMSTSSRELIFCDVSTRIYKCQYRVHGKHLYVVNEVMFALSKTISLPPCYYYNTLLLLHVLTYNYFPSRRSFGLPILIYIS